MRWWDEEWVEQSVLSESVLVGQGGPVADEEAERFETICRDATPGPLMIDDKSEGGGAVVASLPDGRHVVSTSGPLASQADAHAATEANAGLICHARCMVLRLLRDRQHWQQREEGLLERVRLLEAELQRQSDTLDQPQWEPARPVPTRPR